MTTIICHTCQQEITEDVIYSVDGWFFCSTCLDKMDPEKRATASNVMFEKPEGRKEELVPVGPVDNWRFPLFASIAGLLQYVMWLLLAKSLWAAISMKSLFALSGGVWGGLLATAVVLAWRTPRRMYPAFIFAGFVAGGIGTAIGCSLQALFLQMLTYEMATMIGMPFYWIIVPVMTGAIIGLLLQITCRKGLSQALLFFVLAGTAGSIIGVLLGTLPGYGGFGWITFAGGAFPGEISRGPGDPTCSAVGGAICAAIWGVCCFTTLGLLLQRVPGWMNTEKGQ